MSQEPNEPTGGTTDPRPPHAGAGTGEQPGAQPGGAQPGAQPGGQSGEQPGAEFFDGLRRTTIYRPTDDRWIGGVAAGIARRTGLDPLLVRGIFVVVGLFGGVGLVLYGAAWALLPEEADGRIHLQEAIKGNFDAALAAAGAVALVGLLGPATWLWGPLSSPWVIGPLWVGLVIVGVALVMAFSKNQHWRHGPPRTGADNGGSGAGGAGGAGAGSTPAGGATGRTAAGAQSTSTVPPWMPGPTTASAPGAAPSTPGAATGAAGSAPLHGAPNWHVSQWYTPPPRPQKAGPTLVGAVAGLALIAAAAVVIAARNNALEVDVFLAAGGAAVIVLALGVVLAGFLGRKSGGLGFLAVLVALITASVGVGIPGNTQPVGDVTWTPTSAAAAAEGNGVGAGNVTVDLRQVPDHAEEVYVPIRFGAGQVDLKVPADRYVEVTVRIAAGEVVVEDTNGTRKISDNGWVMRERSYVVNEGRSPDDNPIRVSIIGGAGTVTISGALPASAIGAVK